MYHLDGIGAIGYFDALLELDSIKAIQWQPGAGKEAIGQWHELIGRMLAAGKAVQVYARPEEVRLLVNAVGPTGLLVILTGPAGDAEDPLNSYGILA